MPQRYLKKEIFFGHKNMRHIFAQKLLHMDEKMEMAAGLEELETVITPGKNEIKKILEEARTPFFRATIGSGGRFYLIPRIPGAFCGYSRWTKNVLPTSDFLLNYIANADEFTRAERTKAIEYGSAFHHIVAEFERGGREMAISGPNSLWWQNILEQYATRTGLPLSFLNSWRRDLLNDMSAWQKFKKEYDVNVLACEYPVFCSENRIATPVDVICEMAWKKKKILAAIDIKATTADVSGYDSYLLQMLFIQYAFNKTFETIKITNVFNWSLKDRLRSPADYRLKERDFSDKPGGITKTALNLYMKIAAARQLHVPTGNVIYFTNSSNGEIVCTTITAEQWIENWHQKYDKRVF